jgi:hypothetical protein
VRTIVAALRGVVARNWKVVVWVVLIVLCVVFAPARRPAPAARCLTPSGRFA